MEDINETERPNHTTIHQLLVKVFQATVQCYPILTNRNQDELVRYVFCGLEKVAKVVQAVIPLHQQLSTNPDMEMPLGILLRSLLMDAILYMDVKAATLTTTNSNFEEVKAKVKKHCYKIINDPTKRFIEAVYKNNKLSDHEKADLAAKFAAPFSDAFDSSSGKPILRNDYKLDGLSKIASRHLTGGTEIPDATYNLYDYYSKYDHLSHYTAVSNMIAIDHKKNKVNLAILTVAIYIRDLMTLVYNFDEASAGVLPAIQELHDAIMTINPSEFGETGTSQEL